MLKRVSRSRVRATRTETFLAPSGGWMKSGNIVAARPEQAEVLDNFIPTSEGARLRGGTAQYANLGASVVQLMSYASGGVSDLFGATATKLFDVDRVAAGANDYAEIEGLSGGDWSYTQISTSGGQFLVLVNGSDHMEYWNGAAFNPVTDVAVNDLGFDAETAAFTVGATVTGGTSGATAVIKAIIKSSATAGTLRLGTVTGTFQDNEALTDGSGGAATADGANAAGSTVTITGVATASLSQAWLFKERIFFVEKDTSSVWFLPVESIGGAASEINLGSVFRKGGSVLFGATWSLDSGSGLDDVCLIASDRGEIAVYEGTDPASASTWSLVGVYEIGEPLNKHAYFKAGGDLAILTKDGIVPVSKALKEDRAALQAGAISYPIEDAWQDAVSGSSASHRISAALWQSKTLLMVGTPTKHEGKYVTLVANSRTGAWARITGWDVRCSAVSADTLYFGDSSGSVMRADSGGTDNGLAYTAVYVPKFRYSDTLRTANAANVTYRASQEVDIQLHAHSDYVVSDVPKPAPITINNEDTWGTGVWGTFKWGTNSDLSSYTCWQSVAANGYALAPGISITSNQSSFPYFELLSMRLRAEDGYGM